MTPQQQAKVEAARKKSAAALIKKLDAAHDALYEFLSRCRDCQDASVSRGADDSRVLLAQNCRDYANHLADSICKDMDLQRDY